MLTHFIDLGTKGYRETWDLQKQLAEEVKANKAKGVPFRNYLLFVEHPPVYTLGKSGNEANMLMNSLQLNARQAEFIKVDRGGDITFHGPGQLVVYPIFDLEQLGMGVRDYVDALEETVIRTLASYAICGQRLSGATGVWIEPHTPRARKICAIGIKCSHYVTMHGFALNVNTDLTYFNAIHPCGFIDKGVTSMQKETGKTICWEEARQDILTTMQHLFRLQWDESEQ